MMRKKPGIDPRTLMLAIAIGFLEFAIVATWLVSDSAVSVWLSR